LGEIQNRSALSRRATSAEQDGQTIIALPGGVKPKTPQHAALPSELLQQESLRLEIVQSEMLQSIAQIEILRTPGENARR